MKDLSRRSFITAGALAAVGSAAALAGCAPKSGSKTANAGSDGAWVGHGIGKHGDMDIEVVTEGGSITRINVLKSRETQGMGDVAIDELSQLIVDNQTLNVDTISGATLTSMAFLTAVSDALDQSGAQSSNWKKRDHAQLKSNQDIPSQADVVVIGAGGAGFAAAITAANAGKKVVLLEKLGVVGGDTSLSGGEMAVPGNWIQVTDGVADSPALLAADMLKGGDNVGDPALVDVIAQGALDSSQWLTFEGGVSWEHDLLFFGGHSVKRSIIPRGHTGSEMIVKLAARADEIDNLTVIRNMRVTSLSTDAAGAVSGVTAENQITKETTAITARAVVLASGGFGSNVDMRVKYNPDMDSKILSTDSVGATGDGLTMASAIGADLIDMEYIQTYPTCDPETGALLYVDDMRLESRAIMVNKEGVRFVEELGRRDVLSNAIKNQTGGMGYMLWNQSAADETGLLVQHEDEYENLESRGIIVKGDTLEEVAGHFGIDASALKATVEHWNDMCAQGADEDFGYRDKMTPIEGGPYYVNSYKPAVHYTMGGLHINTDAQVLDSAGNPIAGLFAAGEVAGHKMGTNRLGSCSMADIYTFGRIAGSQAAAYVG
ncbi:flavocytochrome c [Cryptobacterium curtum DSM 15641]|uniref:Urocanate reductase n=1 Tax=Cryptobacterium curtum (strain ATCC 700683 / DSM 15641 / CCUG 43107 / 12-3) TaxID=469378 RepID=C7MP67_CRYCD|nr:flavocytochrome c [Cryptobacterium curtum]ACU94707.1 flavocytochrome c [Cryptobacterium curtum DSM 15641]